MRNLFYFLSLPLFLAACSGSSESALPDGSALADAGVQACSAARAQLLGAIDSVASGNVTILSSSAGVTTLYVDASAGGISNQNMNPWSYINLGTPGKVAVTDKTSIISTAWDLALKRPLLYTNSGDGGPGQGGAVLIAKPFDQVSAADAAGVSFGTERLFDAQCNPQLDQTGAALTTLSTWYDYNPNTHTVSPAAGTWLVRGGTGKLYRMVIQAYYGMTDAGTGTGDGGNYTLKVGAL